MPMYNTTFMNCMQLFVYYNYVEKSEFIISESDTNIISLGVHRIA